MVYYQTIKNNYNKLLLSCHVFDRNNHTIIQDRKKRYVTPFFSELIESCDRLVSEEPHLWVLGEPEKKDGQDLTNAQVWILLFCKV